MWEDRPFTAHPVIPWWPSLASWIAAGSQAPVASLLALQILASPLHPEPLWGNGRQRRASAETAVTHQERNLHPAQVLTLYAPATPSLPLASLFPP